MGGQIGIFGGNKIYDPAYLTADITDEGGLVHYAQVRFTIGDYFLTTINKQLYAFKLDGSRIKTSKVKGTRSFRKIYYDTCHYKPISQSNIKEIEIIINKNSLPKLNKKTLNVLKVLGKTEKDQFTVHDITSLKARLLEHEKRYSEEISELINYFATLDTDKIVTPLKRMVEFIEGDLKTADPKYMGSIFSQAVKMDDKSKHVLNPVLTAKKSWMLLILALACVGLVVGLIYVSYDAGYFDNLGSGLISSPGAGADYSQNNLMSKYPDGASLKNAVDSGQLDYNKLPDIAKEIYDKESKK